MTRTTTRLPANTILGYRKNGRPIYTIAGGSQPMPENPGPDTGTGSGGGNPPYAQYLEKFTDPAMKSIAEQAFKEWDGNTTKRFQELHSSNQEKYGWADPLMENYDPEDIQAAVQIAEQLQADPQGFAQRLIDAVGSEQGLGDPDDMGEFDDPDDPYSERFSQLESAISSLTEMLQGKVTTDQQKEEDAELDRTLKELAGEHGEFDEDWVLAKALKNGGDLEAAVKEYAQFEEKIRTNGNRPAPRPLGAGGGLPSSDVDPTKLNDKEARDLVTRILTEANSQ